MTAHQTRAAPRSAESNAALAADHIVIGKDVLELVSSSMYVDPMTVYREYIQNAADAIDVARAANILDDDEPGRVDIVFDPAARIVRIRDNGAGVAADRFARTLTGLGGSAKRGTSARGFRGVGRLAGLGYAQELVFRSRVAGEARVSELRWDCRRLKALLRSTEFDGGVADLISRVATIGSVAGDDLPERFFEVELRGVIRLRSDRLMTPQAVSSYLSQVAPVPFSPEFAFGAEIAAAMRTVMRPADLHIHVGGAEAPLFRPHRDAFDAGHGRMLSYEGVEIRQVPDIDGGVAALAWVLHHPYEGAIPAANLVKGMRMRVGDVQVGDGTSLEELFAEQRFNAWSVGEVHVLDRRLVPNGRRDDFEQNAHLGNLMNQLTPLAREISRRCRTNSIQRNWIRRFHLVETEARALIATLRHENAANADRTAAAAEVEGSVRELERIASLPALKDWKTDDLDAVVTELRAGLAAAEIAPPSAGCALADLPSGTRETYERVFELIRECLPKRAAAQSLIERILERVATDGR